MLQYSQKVPNGAVFSDLRCDQMAFLTLGHVRVHTSWMAQMTCASGSALRCRNSSIEMQDPALRMSWCLDCSSLNLFQNIPARWSWSGDKCIWNVSGLYRKLGGAYARGYPAWGQHLELCWPHSAQSSTLKSVSPWALLLWQLSLQFVVCKPMPTRCPPQPQLCKIDWKAAWKQFDLLTDSTVCFI